MKRRFIALLFGAVLGLNVASYGEVAFTPGTSAAPQAGGSIDFIGSSTLMVQTRGLQPGTYQILAIRRFDRSPIILGSISVSDPGLQPERQAGESRKEDNNSHQATELKTRTELTLPRDLAPKDITRIVLRNLVGDELLVAVLPKG